MSHLWLGHLGFPNGQSPQCGMLLGHGYFMWERSMAAILWVGMPHPRSLAKKQSLEWLELRHCVGAVPRWWCRDNYSLSLSLHYLNYLKAQDVLHHQAFLLSTLSNQRKHQKVLFVLGWLFRSSQPSCGPWTICLIDVPTQSQPPTGFSFNWVWTPPQKEFRTFQPYHLSFVLII